MAKRHPSLVSLSQDHHHGLALALRLRQGDKALLNDGWTHDRREQAKRVEDFYRAELCHHFIAEEKALFPSMRRHVPESSHLIDRLVLQHREMEEIVSHVSVAATHDLATLLVRLGEVLDQHIRAEERELFPMYEEKISEDVARAIQVEMDRLRGSKGESQASSTQRREPQRGNA
ncbi:MAG: Hemerythrin cation binding domain protein [Bacteroidetes bacterium]|nr:Hemerythrin cation binding domain protein [Bacteroidota bacterium]